MYTPIYYNPIPLVIVIPSSGGYSHSSSRNYNNNNSQHNNQNDSTPQGLTLDEENTRKQLNEKLSCVEDDILKQLNQRTTMGVLTSEEQEIATFLRGKDSKGKLNSEQDL